MHHPLRFGFVLVLSLVVSAVAGACGSSRNGSTSTGGGSDGSVDGAGDGGSSGGDGGMLIGSDGSVQSGPLAISPTNQTINVTYGQQTPTVTFTASAGGANVHASFAVDIGQIAAIDASSGLFAPTGKVGGIAHVTATYGGQKVSTAITVVLQLTQNGAPPGFDAGGGAGGNGGVGGSGPGGPVSGGGMTALQGSPMSDPGLAWLYPYDKTVWPQGLLAPLLQWQPGSTGNYDAVYIHLQENGFDYKGYFSAPATPFINHPILQASMSRSTITVSTGRRSLRWISTSLLRPFPIFRCSTPRPREHATSIRLSCRRAARWSSSTSSWRAAPAPWE